MNGIEKITRRIDADTQAEIDQILREAKVEAAKITDKYKAQAAAEAAELKTRNEKAAAEREERLVSAALMESRKTALAAKQELVEKVYDMALEKLCGMSDEQYTTIVADLLAQAAPSGRGTVVFAPEEAKRIGAAAVELANQKLGSGKLTLSQETQPIQGGFILRDERMEVNGTFETLVRLQKAETAGAVAKKLFPEA